MPGQIWTFFTLEKLKSAPHMPISFPPNSISSPFTLPFQAHTFPPNLLFYFPTPRSFDNPFTPYYISRPGARPCSKKCMFFVIFFLVYLVGNVKVLTFALAFGKEHGSQSDKQNERVHWKISIDKIVVQERIKKDEPSILYESGLTVKELYWNLFFWFH